MLRGQRKRDRESSEFQNRKKAGISPQLFHLRSPRNPRLRSESQIKSAQLLSAARNVPRQENAATHKAHRPPPSCRGRGRCKTNLRPAFHNIGHPSSGRRRNRRKQARHFPPPKERRP